MIDSASKTTTELGQRVSR